MSDSDDDFDTLCTSKRAQKPESHKKKTVIPEPKRNKDTKNKRTCKWESSDDDNEDNKERLALACETTPKKRKNEIEVAGKSGLEPTQVNSSIKPPLTLALPNDNTQKPVRQAIVDGPPVRKKSEKAKLNGYDCTDCVAYYKTFNLNEQELKEKLKGCSRHRGTHSPLQEPAHFWDPDFPSTPECERRGYYKTRSEAKASKSDESF